MLGRSTCPLHLSNVHHRNIFLLLETESRDCNISDIYEQNKDHNSELPDRDEDLARIRRMICVFAACWWCTCLH